MESPKVLVIGDRARPHLRGLERLPQEAILAVEADVERLRGAAAAVEIVLCDLFQGRQIPQLLAGMPRLRWIHSVAAGVDHLLFPELVESAVTLTNGRGAYKRALAEFVLTSALYFAKDVARLRRNQHAGRWEPFDMEELAGRTLGIVGYGEIGRATAVLAKAFGMRVLAVRRRSEPVEGYAWVDELLPRERLADLLTRSDYVVVAAALTPATRGLIGAAELAAMKPSAVLINVGRGPVVHETALIQALSAGRIRGAALDVFDVEPLPAGHPFYALDNVLLSPHTADHVQGWLERGLDVFIENYERYRRGDALANVVDKRAGY